MKKKVVVSSFFLIFSLNAMEDELGRKNDIELVSLENNLRPFSRNALIIAGEESETSSLDGNPPTFQSLADDMPGDLLEARLHELGADVQFLITEWETFKRIWAHEQHELRRDQEDLRKLVVGSTNELAMRYACIDAYKQCTHLEAQLNTMRNTLTRERAQHNKVYSHYQQLFTSLIAAQEQQNKTMKQLQQNVADLQAAQTLAVIDSERC